MNRTQSLTTRFSAIFALVALLSLALACESDDGGQSRGNTESDTTSGEDQSTTTGDTGVFSDVVGGSDSSLPSDTTTPQGDGILPRTDTVQDQGGTDAPTPPDTVGDTTTPPDTAADTTTPPGDTGGNTETSDPIPAEGACPSGQQCMDISGGFLLCLQDGAIPGSNQTQCHLSDTGCSGNQSCLYTDGTGDASTCVGNCGECPSSQTCSVITDSGKLGCTVGGGIPGDAVTQCHELEGGCPGNGSCYYTAADYSTSVCIENCSGCQPGSCGAGMVCGPTGVCEAEPCTAGSCPGDDICVNGTCVPDIGNGPGHGPGASCSEIPAMTCTGTAAYCGALIQFDPTEGYGYVDYAENGETLDDQYRSWLRRDAVMAIQYAAAVVQCKAADWAFGNGGPIGTIDMSEPDGSIPGTSIGSPGHPEGTHVNGHDIDMAYYQVNTPDNRARPICDHYEGGSDAYHCTAAPHLLDPWRSALFIGALFEHPNLRVIGVDGKVGAMVMSALQYFCANEWLSTGSCNNIALAYEEENQNQGWYYFHHHHMHVSFNSGSYGGSNFMPGETPWAPTAPIHCIVPGCEGTRIRAFYEAQGVEFKEHLRPVLPTKP